MIYHGNHHGKNFLSGRFIIHHFFEASLVAQLVKNPPAMRETWFDPWVGKIPGEGIGYPLQYSLASLVAQRVKNTPAM